jgi:CRAL/TRIO domain
MQYMMVTEFQWQYLERDDLQRSVYIIDLDGIRFGDFVGEVVDFVKKASSLSAQHYPERAGYVFVINVPAWFKIIFSVIRPLIDESTLDKIYILRGAEEIRQNMLERIPIESIPADYGGQGPPLGQSDEEKEFRMLVEHNNALARGEVPSTCSSHTNRPCRFCSWQQPRSY